jgi:hypothetical protein
MEGTEHIGDIVLYSMFQTCRNDPLALINAETGKLSSCNSITENGQILDKKKYHFTDDLPQNFLLAYLYNQFMAGVIYFLDCFDAVGWLLAI